MRSSSDRDRSFRRAAARPLLLAAAGLVAFLLLLALWSLDPRGAQVVLDPARPGAAGSEGAAELSAERAQLADAALVDASPPARARAHVETGVRLAGPGRLTGRVVERASGAGVAGARVELLALPPAGTELVERMLRLARVGAGLARRAEPIAVATTDARGEFSFSGVREGSYYLDAICDQHLPEAPEQVQVLASGAGGPATLFVRAGGGVRGRMTLRDGSAVSRAEVVLLPGPGLVLRSAYGGSLRALGTRTDARGEFVFLGVAPGEGYEITAQGPGTTVSHAIDITVRAGADTEVTLEARVGGSVQGRVLSLKVVDGEEAGDAVPLAGAHVAAVPRGLRDLRFAEELLAATHALTGADGSFTLRNVPPGEVDLIGFAPGHLIGVEGPVVVFDEASAEAPEIELESGPSVAGRVVDGDGAPIAGVQLRWNTFDFRQLGRNQLEIRFAPFLTQAIEGFEFPLTDGDGRFVAGPFPGDPPHRIEFYAPGYQDARPRWTPGEGPEELEVVLRRGGGIEGVVMDLARAEPVTRFRVQTFDRVEQAVDEPGRFNPFAGGLSFEDPAGRFALPAMRTGAVTLTFRADGFLPVRMEEIQVVEGETTRGLIVKMVPGGAVSGTVVGPKGTPVAGAQVLALVPGAGRERGRRGDRGGPPIDLASQLPPALLGYAAGVGLLTEQAVRSDASGAFELRGLAPGPTRIVALHPEHAPGSIDDVLVVASETTDGVVVELSSGGGIYGTVEDRYGRPLPGSYVIAFAPAGFAPGAAADHGGGLYQSLADASGDYRIEHMSAGSYFLVATRGNEALDPLSFLQSFDFDLVTVPGDELVRYDIVDEAAGGTRLHGFVSDRGEPVERGSLSAIGFESGNLLGVDFKVARIRAGGAYEFAGLAPGEYQMQLEGAGARVRMQIEVPDAPEYRLDLELPIGSLEGEVVEALTGQPVAGCELLLSARDEGGAGGLVASMIRSQGRVVRARSDGEGRFVFERLAEGDYQLTARPRNRGEGARLGPSEPLEVELRRAERRRGLRVELPVALRLTGIVRGEGGEAIAGARLTALAGGADDPRAARARSGEDGRFELGGLAVGEYDLSASADGYASRRVEGLMVRAGAEEELEVVLERGVLVHLRLTGPDGRPLSGARARLSREGDGEAALGDLDGAFQQLLRGQGGTDDEGRLELGRHAPGTYGLSVLRGLSRTTIPGIVISSGSDAVDLSVSVP